MIYGPKLIKSVERPPPPPSSNRSELRKKRVSVRSFVSNQRYLTWNVSSEVIYRNHRENKPGKKKRFSFIVLFRKKKINLGNGATFAEKPQQSTTLERLLVFFWGRTRQQLDYSEKEAGNEFWATGCCEENKLLHFETANNSNENKNGIIRDNLPAASSRL